ncbi:hypothetical protein [Streptomyces sp. NPDC002602]|uniref:hypothetical protein n=1 Tax=Streptomyces sp. NPDC002602 TaxID=3364654 RepID=UPI0036997B73
MTKIIIVLVECLPIRRPLGQSPAAGSSEHVYEMPASLPAIRKNGSPSWPESTGNL